MYYFCTYFDINYLSRGLALYESLDRHCSPFVLWILCMDDESYAALAKMTLPHARLISLAEFEEGDAALLEAKGNRSLIEYYFTCTPSLPLYVLKRCAEAEVVTYLDADLFFFSNPSPIFEEMGDGSILVIEHRFPAHLKELEERGIFNVGLLSFRRDEEGMACLTWWRDRCLEWCYDRYEDGRFADQKYLDLWPQLFPGLRVLQNKGAGLAPWNAGNYAITRDRDVVRVDADELIFYHFHGFHQAGRRTYDTGLERFDVRINSVIRRHIYRPYVQAVLRASQLAQAAGPTASTTGNMRYTQAENNNIRPTSWLRRVRFGLGRIARAPQGASNYVRRLLAGESLLVVGNYVL
jgi:hypothetical protein